MADARLLITSVVVEKRSVPEVAARYGVSRSWLYELLARYRREGEAAFEPRSRRPHTSTTALSADVVDLIVELREKLIATGLDAGPDTIGWHLARHHDVTVCRATVARWLAKRGLVTPQPRKRPRSSYVRFAAEMPNECWQAYFTPGANRSLRRSATCWGFGGVLVERTPRLKHEAVRREVIGGRLGRALQGARTQPRKRR